jgi:hypothetical protein
LSVGVASPDQNHVAAFQLTTQSQAAMVDATDKSVISTGKISISAATPGNNTTVSESMDIAPQHWTNGYLIGVEQIYLGVDQTMNLFSSGGVTIVMECTVETLSSSAAMALALSQQ